MTDSETYAIIGAAMEVHRHLYCGYVEHVYQLALAKEFELRGIPFEREVEVPISYKGEPLGTNYRADFVCYGSIIVELKAVAEITQVHKAQILNYIKATGFTRGVLINFGEDNLKYERYTNNWIR